MKTLELGKYEHYKGKEYEVIGVARHSETLEELVVYKALYKNGDLWVRPKPLFFSKVTVDGRKIERFKYISK